MGKSRRREKVRYLGGFYVFAKKLFSRRFFCKIMTFFVATMFLVPAVPHVDDNIIVESVAGMQSARQAMVLVHQNIRRSPDGQPTRLTLLGGELRNS